MIGYHQCSEISIRKGFCLYNFTIIFEAEYTHTHTYTYVYVYVHAHVFKFYQN